MLRIPTVFVNPVPRILGVLLLLSVAAHCSSAQQTCPPIHVPPIDLRTDIFNDRQEMDLGDAMADQIQRNFLVTDDEGLTGYVQRVGEKLLAQAPPTNLKVRFFLFDLPVANAITLPGGRIYVSRKLIALARNENELASVLGHELGHLLTHQSAIHLTGLFREVLGVTQAGSREELFRDYQELQDNLIKKRKVFQRVGSEGQQEQLIADHIGLQLVANAGYSTAAFADFFDRLADTKGKTGGWLSDLFGATRPESRRLREILKGTPTPSTSCAKAANASPQQDFSKWQSSVIAYAGFGHKERIRGVLFKSDLDPPLQSDLVQLRFSPDGNYLLAQNESTIFVMTRDPLNTKFTIYAPDAYPAKFSRDSESITFYTPGLRVETWSVPDEARISTSELVLTHGCLQSEISADGRLLACYGGEHDLSIYDVSTGEPSFQKKNFYEPGFRDFFLLIVAAMLHQTNIPILQMQFSPDARYFVAHSPEDGVIALNLDDFRAFSLPGSIRKLLVRNFTFVGPDKIVGLDAGNPKDSALVAFPGGEILRKLELGGQRLDAGTNPRYLILRPIKDYPAGVVDLESWKGVLATSRAPLDIFGEVYARERDDGDVGLYRITSGQHVAHVKLPLGKLGHLKAAAVSPDLHWLAVSEISRGGVWDLLRGQRVFFVRGFSGAWISPEGKVTADFSKHEKEERQIGIMDVMTRQGEKGRSLTNAEISDFGSILLRTTRNDQRDWRRHNQVIEALDAASGAVLWSHTYPKEAPAVLSHQGETNLVFSWTANSDGAKLEIAENPDLSKRWPKLDAAASDYFLESVDPRSGKVLGGVVARTGKGSFSIHEAESAGTLLVAADSNNRLLIYSLTSGERTGIVFGGEPVISVATGLMATQNERGELSLYDLSTLARREQYAFKSPIAFVAFAADNQRFVVLTGDQVAYTMELPVQAASALTH